MKPIIFISHITEEKTIALELKVLVVKAFAGLVEVFVSTDPMCLKAGQKWLNTIEASLKGCVIEIILASNASVVRPWINFEAGAGWIRDIPVIPFCHSGMIPEKLPEPLKSLTGLIATDEEDVLILIRRIAEEIGCSQIPMAVPDSFIEIVKKYEEDTREYRAMAAKNPDVAATGLVDFEIALVQELASHPACYTGEISIWSLQKDMVKSGFSNVATNIAVKTLERKGLIEIGLNGEAYRNDESPSAMLTETGWEWVIENQRMFEMSVKPKIDLEDDIQF